MTVLLGSGVHEVTTYRIDGEYEDSRHPRDVTFTASLEEDLKRRDFTINAMAYNETAGLVDLYGGMEDLQKRRDPLRGKSPGTGSAKTPLRIMRSVRFSAQLHFSIEKKDLGGGESPGPHALPDQRGADLRGTSETASLRSSRRAENRLGGGNHPGCAAGI